MVLKLRRSTECVQQSVLASRKQLNEVNQLLHSLLFDRRNTSSSIIGDNFFRSSFGKHPIYPEIDFLQELGIL